jgi:hypothetical protein
LKLGLLQTFETAEGHRQDGVGLILSKAEAFIETAADSSSVLESRMM